MRLLVGEEEQKASRELPDALRARGDVVEETHTASQALTLASSGSYHAIILAAAPPDFDGLTILRDLRRRGIATPIVLLAARDDPAERLEALESGADEYLAQTVALRELLLRIDAMSRRAASEAAPILSLGDLVMNVPNHQVTRAGRAIHLPLREFSLLEFLLRHPNEAHSRATLREHVWSHHAGAGASVVDVYIQRLRRKLDEGHSIKLLHTVRGVGYALRLPGPASNSP